MVEQVPEVGIVRPWRQPLEVRCGASSFALQFMIQSVYHCIHKKRTSRVGEPIFEVTGDLREIDLGTHPGCRERLLNLGLLKPSDALVFTGSTSRARVPHVYTSKDERGGVALGENEVQPLTVQDYELQSWSAPRDQAVGQGEVALCGPPSRNS